MGIFDSLFKKRESILSINLSFNDNLVSFVIDDGVITPKAIMMASCLCYARILRVIASKEEKNQIVDSFIALGHESNEVGFSIDIIESLLDIFQINYKYALTRSKRLILQKSQNGNYLIDMGSITIDPISPVGYSAFRFAWNLLQSKDKRKLCEIYSLISTECRLNGLSLISAVSLPNQLVEEHFANEA